MKLEVRHCHPDLSHHLTDPSRYVHLCHRLELMYLPAYHKRITRQQRA